MINEESFLGESEIRGNRDIIWHYTSRDVFVQFVEGQTGLYATHYKSLSDPAEYQYGMKVIHKLLTIINNVIDEKINITNDEIKKSSFERKKQYWNSFDFQRNIELFNDVYIMSFCQNPDSGYHWIKFTPDGGYCIGFSRKIFENIFRANTVEDKYVDFNLYSMTNSSLGNICIEDCIYDRDKIKQYIGTLLTNNDDYIWKSLQIVYSLAKRQEFEIEKETRIVRFGQALNHLVEVVGGKPRIPIPGCEKDKVLNLIKGVFVSPRGERNNNINLAKLLSEKHGSLWPVFSGKISCDDEQ